MGITQPQGQENGVEKSWSSPTQVGVDGCSGGIRALACVWMHLLMRETPGKD